MTEDRRPVRRKGRGHTVVVILSLLAVSAIAAIWRFTPLHDYLNLENVVTLGQALRGHPAAPLLVLCAYLVGALVFFPITLLLSATALIFDPVRGLIYGYTSTLAAAVMTYGIGRLLRRPGVGWLAGPRLSRVRDRLQHRGLVAIIVARLIPVGSFSLVNIAAGMLMIRWRDFLIGNMIGLLPGILALTILAGRLRAALRDPAPANLLNVVIPGVLVVALLAILMIRSAVRRQRRKRARTPKASDASDT